MSKDLFKRWMTRRMFPGQEQNKKRTEGEECSWHLLKRVEMTSPLLYHKTSSPYIISSSLNFTNSSPLCSLNILCLFLYLSPMGPLPAMLPPSLYPLLFIPIHPLYINMSGKTSSKFSSKWDLLYVLRASLVAQWVKSLPAIQESHVRSLGWEDSLEKDICSEYNLSLSFISLIMVCNDLLLWVILYLAYIPPSWPLSYP